MYNVDTTTSTNTGQPIETLIYTKDIKVFFSPSPRRIYQLFEPGQIPIGEFVAISSDATVTNQVLEIDNVKYRIQAANPATFKNRTFAYINYLGRY